MAERGTKARKSPEAAAASRRPSRAVLARQVVAAATLDDAERRVTEVLEGVGREPADVRAMLSAVEPELPAEALAILLRIAQRLFGPDILGLGPPEDSRSEHEPAGPALGPSATDTARAGTRGRWSAPAAAVASAIGEATGVDVSRARIHTGPEAHAAAKALSAEAFTLGWDVVLSSPNVSQDTLAHELAHVAQQNAPVRNEAPFSARPGPTRGWSGALARGPIALPGVYFEGQANRIAAAASRGERADVTATPGWMVQRKVASPGAVDAGPAAPKATKPEPPGLAIRTAMKRWLTAGFAETSPRDARDAETVVHIEGAGPPEATLAVIEAFSAFGSAQIREVWAAAHDPLLDMGGPDDPSPALSADALQGEASMERFCRMLEAAPEAVQRYPATTAALIDLTRESFRRSWLGHLARSAALIQNVVGRGTGDWAMDGRLPELVAASVGVDAQALMDGAISERVKKEDADAAAAHPVELRLLRKALNDGNVADGDLDLPAVVEILRPFDTRTITGLLGAVRAGRPWGNLVSAIRSSDLAVGDNARELSALLRAVPHDERWKSLLDISSWRLIGQSRAANVAYLVLITLPETQRTSFRRDHAAGSKRVMENAERGELQKIEAAALAAWSARGPDRKKADDEAARRSAAQADAAAATAGRSTLDLEAKATEIAAKADTASQVALLLFAQALQQDPSGALLRDLARRVAARKSLVTWGTRLAVPEVRRPPPGVIAMPYREAYERVLGTFSPAEAILAARELIPLDKPGGARAARFVLELFRAQPLEAQTQLREDSGGRRLRMLYESLPHSLITEFEGQIPGLDATTFGVGTKGLTSGLDTGAAAAEQALAAGTARRDPSRGGGSGLESVSLELRRILGTSERATDLQAPQYEALYRLLRSCPAGTRAALVRRLEVGGVLRRLFTTLPFEWIWSAENRPFSLEILCERDPQLNVELIRDIVYKDPGVLVWLLKKVILSGVDWLLEQMEAGFPVALATPVGWLVSAISWLAGTLLDLVTAEVSPSEAGLALNLFKALPDAERRKIVEERPDLWSKIWDALDVSQRNADDIASSYRGGEGQRDKVALLGQLADPAIWAIAGAKSTARLHNVVRMALAAGSRRDVFDVAQRENALGEGDARRAMLLQLGVIDAKGQFVEKAVKDSAARNFGDRMLRATKSKAATYGFGLWALTEGMVTGTTPALISNLLSLLVAGTMPEPMENIPLDHVQNMLGGEVAAGIHLGDYHADPGGRDPKAEQEAAAKSNRLTLRLGGLRSGFVQVQLPALAIDSYKTASLSVGRIQCRNLELNLSYPTKEAPDREVGVHLSMDAGIIEDILSTSASGMTAVKLLRVDRVVLRLSDLPEFAKGVESKQQAIGGFWELAAKSLGQFVTQVVPLFSLKSVKDAVGVNAPFVETGEAPRQSLMGATAALGADAQLQNLGSIRLEVDGLVVEGIDTSDGKHVDRVATKGTLRVGKAGTTSEARLQRVRVLQRRIASGEGRLRALEAQLAGGGDPEQTAALRREKDRLIAGLPEWRASAQALVSQMARDSGTGARLTELFNRQLAGEVLGSAERIELERALAKPGQSDKRMMELYARQRAGQHLTPAEQMELGQRLGKNGAVTGMTLESDGIEISGVDLGGGPLAKKSNVSIGAVSGAMETDGLSVAGLADPGMLASLAGVRKDTHDRQRDGRIRGDGDILLDHVSATNVELPSSVDAGALARERQTLVEKASRVFGAQLSAVAALAGEALDGIRRLVSGDAAPARPVPAAAAEALTDDDKKRLIALAELWVRPLLQPVSVRTGDPKAPKTIVVRRFGEAVEQLIRLESDTAWQDAPALMERGTLQRLVQTAYYEGQKRIDSVSAEGIRLGASGSPAREGDGSAVGFGVAHAEARGVDLGDGTRLRKVTLDGLDGQTDVGSLVALARGGQGNATTVRMRGSLASARLEGLELGAGGTQIDAIGLERVRAGADSSADGGSAEAVVGRLAISGIHAAGPVQKLQAELAALRAKRVAVDRGAGNGGDLSRVEDARRLIDDRVRQLERVEAQVGELEAAQQAREAVLTGWAEQIASAPKHRRRSLEAKRDAALAPLDADLQARRQALGDWALNIDGTASQDLVFDNISLGAKGIGNLADLMSKGAEALNGKTVTLSLGLGGVTLKNAMTFDSPARQITVGAGTSLTNLQAQVALFISTKRVEGKAEPEVSVRPERIVRFSLGQFQANDFRYLERGADQLFEVGIRQATVKDVLVENLDLSGSSWLDLAGSASIGSVQAELEAHLRSGVGGDTKDVRLSGAIKSTERISFEAKPNQGDITFNPGSIDIERLRAEISQKGTTAGFTFNMRGLKEKTTIQRKGGKVLVDCALGVASVSALHYSGGGTHLALQEGTVSGVRAKVRVDLDPERLAAMKDPKAQAPSEGSLVTGIAVEELFIQKVVGRGAHVELGGAPAKDDASGAPAKKKVIDLAYGELNAIRLEMPNPKDTAQFSLKMGQAAEKTLRGGSAVRLDGLMLDGFAPGFGAIFASATCRSISLDSFGDGRGGALKVQGIGGGVAVGTHVDKTHGDGGMESGELNVAWGAGSQHVDLKLPQLSIGNIDTQIGGKTGVGIALEHGRLQGLEAHLSIVEHSDAKAPRGKAGKARTVGLWVKADKLAVQKATITAAEGGVTFRLEKGDLSGFQIGSEEEMFTAELDGDGKLVGTKGHAEGSFQGDYSVLVKGLVSGGGAGHLGKVQFDDFGNDARRIRVDQLGLGAKAGVEGDKLTTLLGSLGLEAGAVVSGVDVYLVGSTVDVTIAEIRAGIEASTTVHPAAASAPPQPGKDGDAPPTDTPKAQSFEITGFSPAMNGSLNVSHDGDLILGVVVTGGKPAFKLGPKLADVIGGFAGFVLGFSPEAWAAVPELLRQSMVAALDGAIQTVLKEKIAGLLDLEANRDFLSRAITKKLNAPKKPDDPAGFSLAKLIAETGRSLSDLIAGAISDKPKGDGRLDKAARAIRKWLEDNQAGQTPSGDTEAYWWRLVASLSLNGSLDFGMGVKYSALTPSTHGIRASVVPDSSSAATKSTEVSPRLNATLIVSGSLAKGLGVRPILTTTGTTSVLESHTDANGQPVGTPTSIHLGPLRAEVDAKVQADFSKGGAPDLATTVGGSVKVGDQKTKQKALQITLRSES